MVGPNININIGPRPRRRRRRRAAAGGGLLALILLAVFGYSLKNRTSLPAPPPGPRLPSAAQALERLRIKDLQQIPATVVDKGPLRHVPYLSYRMGDVEFNVYGDPDAPACIEIGLFGRADPERRAALRSALASTLPDAEDGRALLGLDLAKGKSTRAGLTVETTPETAPDAYGAWWASVYDPRGLDASRASEAELKQMAGPRPAGDEAAKSRPGGTVYVKGYYRKDGTYVPGYEKKAK